MEGRSSPRTASARRERPAAPASCSTCQRPDLPDVRHATLIAAFLGAAGWRGVLLVGPSGAGKSDLALRAAAEGWRLVADDRVILWASGGRLYGRPPETLRGLIELRGQAVLSTQTLLLAQVALVARLGQPPDRQPEPRTETLAGVQVPGVRIAPFEASAPARLRRIVEQSTARL